jgi:hypothetical protein
MLYCDLLDILKARENGSDGLSLNFVQIELTAPQITLRNRTMTFRKLLYPYDSGRVNLSLLRSQNPPIARSWGFDPPPGTINTTTYIIVGSKPGADFVYSLSKLLNQIERPAEPHVVRPFSLQRKIIISILAPIGGKRA